MPNKYKKWIHLPKHYPLTVGDTFELFYRGVIHCSNPYKYNIKVTCKKGNAYMKKFVFTPTEDDIGEIPLTIELSDDYGQELDSASVTLNVSPAAKSPKAPLNVICVGASTTAGGQWPSECNRRLTANDGTPQGLGLENIRFIGGKEGKYGTFYEGYGGWRFDSYNSEHLASSFRYIKSDHSKTDSDRHSTYTDGVTEWKLEEIEDGRIKLIRTKGKEPLNDSGILKHVSGGLDNSDIVYTEVTPASGNPFWNAKESRVDFSGYCKRIGADGIDVCITLLGWNSWSSYEGQIKEQVRLFINNLRADYPECRIILLGINPPSTDGLAVSYGASWNFVEKFGFVMNLNKWYTDIAAEFENVYFVSTAGQFDLENNFPTVDRPKNCRTDSLETVQSNGVHPTYDGYMQIADAAFRQLNELIIKDFN
nr:hypothetical protein [Clostridia bacterium]